MEETFLLKVRYESRVTPRSLTLLEREIEVPRDIDTGDVVQRRIALGCSKKDSIGFVRI